jgi:secreted trypsin-like serine protease
MFDISGTIIGGQITTPYFWPWQLAIETDDGSEFRLHCGGVVIGENWGLTAAHCVTPRPGGEQLLAISGLYNRTEIFENTQIRLLSPADITIHPEFDELTLLNDLAILHFPDALDLSGIYTRSICLPPSASTSYVENPNCYITGWGQTTPGGELSESLQRISTDVIDPLHCELRLNRTVLATETCTFDEVTRSDTACHGDMGGPLGCVVNAQFYVAGIGSIVDADCDARVPQIYTNIPQYVDWIRSIVGDLTPRKIYDENDFYY